eukprot:245136-Amphidinium_carterae.1
MPHAKNPPLVESNVRDARKSATIKYQEGNANKAYDEINCTSVMLASRGTHKLVTTALSINFAQSRSFQSRQKQSYFPKKCTHTVEQANI